MRSLSVLCAAIALTGCQRQPAASKTAPATVPVKVAQAVQGTSPISVRAVGAVEPIASVMLRPQISAQVLSAPAGEGVDVTSGAVIIQLDARPFDATLKQAQANLDRDRAMAADAHKAAEQYASASLAKAMPVRTTEEAQAKAVAADATVAADEAALQTAKLNLEYCTITAPFAGRLGSLQVKPGAVVKLNETDLVELVQITPIDVAFSVPEDRLPAISAAQAKSPLPVSVQIPGSDGPALTGAVAFVDNRVDPGTGTIRLKARFENKDRSLWPGQFVNATLTLGLSENVVLVPSEAVQPSQDGASVFVVKDDHTVEMRRVAAGRSSDGRTVIAAGVSAGETVVTDGQLRLTAGTTVEAR